MIEYKLLRRGQRTSAAFDDVKSRIFIGGGGSWSYGARDGGTDWTQTNTLELKPNNLGRLFAPLVRRNLAAATRDSMARARAIMESAAAIARGA